MKHQNIRAIAHKKLIPILEEIGLRKRKEGIFTKEFEGDFIGWLGLPDVVSKGVISISPIVAVRSQEVERLRCLFKEKAFHKYIPPHAKISLGYLLPENSWREWSFSEESSIHELEDFVENIKSYALRFMEKYSIIELFEEIMASYSGALAADQREIYPIVKLVRGDFEGAAEVVNKYCKYIYADTDPRAVSYKNVFAPAILNYIDETRTRDGS